MLAPDLSATDYHADALDAAAECERFADAYRQHNLTRQADTLQSAARVLTEHVPATPYRLVDAADAYVETRPPNV